VHWEASRALTEGLKALGRGEGATLFMTLLAAFSALLSRYAGQRDVVVGAPVAGRTRPETEGLIGFFVNTLALRTDLSGDPTFVELLGRVRETTLGAYDHQDIPFEKLVEELRPERSLSRTPLFQVMLDVRTEAAGELRLPGLSMETMVVEWEAAKFDLLFDLVEGRDGILRGDIEYSTDLFEAETVRRMLGHWLTLLEGIAADPQLRLSQLRLLTDVEESQLAAWNETRADYPRARCVHELFEEQAARTPDTIAVADGSYSLTYAELNARANRIAHSLAGRGAGPETIVALLMERNADLLAAVLGAFKAGAPYLPLDPRHPAARHRQVLARSRAGLIVSTGAFSEMLSEVLDGPDETTHTQVLLAEELLRREDADGNLGQHYEPNNLAYVIYTSGSTGVPKGAMVEHGGMLNHLFAKIEDLELTGADTVAQTASQCFDISVWQMLAVLLVGGRTHILDDETVQDPLRMLDEAARAGVTILEVVPSLLRAALDNLRIRQAERRELPGLRLLILTGEALPPALCRQWLTDHPGTPLLNAYGPTECSDDVTHHFIHEPPEAEAAHVPVGRPIINTRIYILDDSLRPVPVGVRGELYVAGDGVGRGYLNEPALTAEAFVPDMFAAEPGGRLYKTGDLARFAPDGVIEYLGRRDNQVKVRGYRIETDEVEAALGAHAGVRESVVAVVGDDVGDRHLVAYVVAAGAPAPTADVLRDFLRGRLPDYMIPSAFVALDAMPLSPNGKLDRRRLPAPDPESLVLRAAYVEPQTETEKEQARIWAEVLRVERVGIDDNFFDLGGHSLAVTQLISRLRVRFGVELTLAEFFAAATIRVTSEKIESALMAQASSSELDELLNMLEGLDNVEADNLLAADELPKLSQQE
jgi:amino acid adenylation domain-containing protein